MAAIGLSHYLAVGALLFGLGLAVVIIRRNAIAVLMGLELMLNGAALNFVAFSRYVDGGAAVHAGMRGQAVSVFIIVLAAAEAALALAIILNLYHNFDTVDVDQPTTLRE